MDRVLDGQSTGYVSNNEHLWDRGIVRIQKYVVVSSRGFRLSLMLRQHGHDVVDSASGWKQRHLPD
jgi:hypothetical protein